MERTWKKQCLKYAKIEIQNGCGDWGNRTGYTGQAMREIHVEMLRRLRSQKSVQFPTVFFLKIFRVQSEFSIRDGSSSAMFCFFWRSD